MELLPPLKKGVDAAKPGRGGILAAQNPRYAKHTAGPAGVSTCAFLQM
ncbi:MAG: hypothetical protein K0R12_1128 [Gammaproteobacteria bacterium]|jgi:hypothetical protein|nr:hypothetical protein [Gammaproteobacteria bacterium]